MGANVVREAKLFECGNYPDRGISFTEADLDAIVAGFKEDSIPVRIRAQHTHTPWDDMLGHVREIWRAGRDLMGRLEFPEVVWKFLEAMGTKKLSVGFDYRQRRLREVSIVDNPRILTARIFGDNIAESGLLIFEDSFGAGSETLGGGSVMPELITPEFRAMLDREREAGKAEGAAAAEAQFTERLGPVSAENAELKRRMAKERAAVIIAGWKLEGKLTPASEKFAEGLLVDGLAEVTFADGGHMTVAESFVQFMTYQVPGLTVVKSGGSAVAERPAGSAGGGESKEEAMVYSMLGVTAEEVAEAERLHPDPTR
ncbi:MAG: hypothetical protein B7Z62_00335 [Deltaproteobacteria bacterium 37-65-8]|nr:MAG: hypothetical protein B7Z62_00335 [Deltaproteobacteria bacterium 37-65-8]